MNVIIPMTGYGSRFVAAGYKELKPFIKVMNTASSFAPSFSHAEQTPTLDDGTCSVSGGDAESFPKFKARHPELTPKQALDAWRAKRRGKHLNGGFHM